MTARPRASGVSWWAQRQCTTHEDRDRPVDVRRCTCGNRAVALRRAERVSSRDTGGGAWRRKRVTNKTGSREGMMNKSGLATQRRAFLVRSAAALMGAVCLPARVSAGPERPYLYHYVSAFKRSHGLSQGIARSELSKAGFTMLSEPAAWEHVATNAETIAVVSNVPLSASKTYVHVLVTANTDAPAKKWAAAIMKAIQESKMTLLD